MVQFRLWFDEAREVMAEREAIALVSADATGAPSARMVLLRHLDARSFGWYTNYRSRKGRELEANPRAALLWYCEALGRQVRAEGRVERMTPAESDAYFAQRPRAHQIGAHASAQSEPLASRAALEALVAVTEARFSGLSVPRPAHWGGYRLVPEAVEFWQRRDDRLHDRVLYERAGVAWRRERRAP
ncbi:MAG: pyridoxamine 5'-phosphate oxidase [Acidobacteriota bacterium]|nr:pyridoxamine 5'-phosphate oxidase [Acidobacteriota bacterium]